MERHQEVLSKLCRVCGKTIKKEKDRKPKEVKNYLSAAKYLNLSVTDDLEGVHPQLICEACRKVLSKIESAVKTGKAYQPNITVFNDYLPHNDKNCPICDGGENLKSVGRSRILKQVNHQHNNSTCHRVEVRKPLESSFEELETPFEPISLKDYAEKLGYATINDDEQCVMFSIFVRRMSPYLQIRNLLTVTINNDCHWNVHIDEKDISTEIIFDDFSEVLTKDSCMALFSLCVECTFCSGNEDFSDLCKSRSEEGNNALFKDRKDGIVASEVNDVICLCLELESTIRHKDCRMMINSANKRCDV